MKLSTLNMRVTPGILVLYFMFASLPALLPSVTVGQAVLEEILVTAQKRSQAAQEVPISINIVSGEQIVESGITDLGDLGQYVPNFSFNQTGISSTIKMRGISSGINPGFEQSVGMYIDGIYYGRGQLARIPYLDLDRVEVLRGPQSILFGKNTIAGALNILTVRPTEKLDGHVRFAFDHETGRKEYNLAIGGKIANGFNARFSYMNREVDGYYDNTFLNREESNDEEETLRLGLFFGNEDDTSVYLKIEQTEFNSLGRFLEVINPVGAVPYAAALATLFGTDGEAGTGYILESEQDYRRHSNGDTSFNDHNVYLLEYNKKMRNGGEFIVTVGQNEFDTKERCDCDFISANIFDTNSREEYSQTSLEVRYNSPGDQVVDYTVGGYFQRYEQTLDDFITVPTNGVLPTVVLGGAARALGANPAFQAGGPLESALTALVGSIPTLAATYAGSATGRNFTQDSIAFSLFAQVTYNINENMRIVFGGRYTDERKTGTRRQFHVDNNGVDQGASHGALNAFYGLLSVQSYDKLRNTRDEDVFTPLITWQWDFLPGELWYVTLTQGYKAGGFDVRSNLHPGLDYRENPGQTQTPYVLAFDGPNAAGMALAIASGGNLAGRGVGSFEYEEERADTFETGVKSILANGAAEFNVAWFVTSYEDLQISQFDGGLGFNVTNAGEASVSGIEIDTRWNITENFQLRGTLGYLDFEYDNFPDSECDFASLLAGRTTCDLKGRTAEFAPEITALVSLDYTLPTSGGVNVAFGVDVEYSDDYYVSPTLDENLRQESFARVDARMEITPKEGSWQVLFNIKNINNVAVNNFGNRAPLSTTLTGNEGTLYYAFFQPQRSFLFQYAYNF